MNVLALSYLFPNNQHPNYGIFVLNRLSSVAEYCNVKVLAPIPWFPFRQYLPSYTDSSDIPYYEKNTKLEIYHPRFFVIPKFLKWLDGLFYFFGTVSTIMSIKKEFDIDLIDVHWVYPDIITGYVLSKVFQKPMIVTIRGREVICFGERSFRKKIIDYFLRRSDHIVCLSNELAGIAKDIGIDPNKISVVPNGVDTDVFRPLNKMVCRNELGLPADNKIILSVGALIEGKGFHRIIECMPDLLRKYPDILLYIIGSTGPAGNFKKELINQIQTLALQDKIFLMGARPNHELVKWYNTADVFCLATSGEGSPNVVLEAISCGCPVIASAVGGILEIMCEEFLGNTFDVSDENELRLKLNQFFEKEWNRRRIRSYMEGFSWDWCARKVMGIYQDVYGKEVI